LHFLHLYSSPSSPIGRCCPNFKCNWSSRL
jgi:hypothetical protein